MQEAATLKNDQVIQAVRRWVETIVIGMNLCPFAKRELSANRLRFVVTTAETEQALLEALASELELLGREPDVETTLVVHPKVLRDFLDYNQFLDRADDLILALDLEGEFQVASFHPDYQFAGTEPNDAENYRCRSPYPILHLLREATLEQAIERTADVDQIPSRNIEAMNTYGVEVLRETLRACLDSE